MADLLAREKTYLSANHVELAVGHPGRFPLIKGETVYGAFETYEQDVIAGTKKFGSDSFLVRLISQPEDSEAPAIPALPAGVPLIAHP